MLSLSLRERSSAIVTAFDSANAFASTDRDPAIRRTVYALPRSSFHFCDWRNSSRPTGARRNIISIPSVERLIAQPPKLSDLYEVLIVQGPTVTVQHLDDTDAGDETCGDDGRCPQHPFLPCQRSEVNVPTDRSMLGLRDNRAIDSRIVLPEGRCQQTNSIWSAQLLGRSKQQRLRTLSVRQFPDQTRAISGALDSQMYAPRPLMIPAPSLATMPAATYRIRHSTLGRYCHRDR